MEKKLKQVSMTKKEGDAPKKPKKWDYKKYLYKRNLTQN